MQLMRWVLAILQKVSLKIILHISKQGITLLMPYKIGEKL